jgi:hypothetical protein
MTAEESIERWRRAKAEREAARQARLELIEAGHRPDEFPPERMPVQTPGFGQTFPKVIHGYEARRRYLRQR